MGIYDISGNIISAEGDLKTAFLELVASGEINIGSAVGATLVYNNLSSSWITNATAAYNSMKAKYEELANCGIPFFISTDQHGRGVEQHRWANNIDVDGIGFANINLGDTVTNYFNNYQLYSMYGRTKQVKNYISITGNHDALYNGNERPTIFDLTRYFTCTYDMEVIAKKNSSYTVVDKAHNVKYIVVDSYSDVGVTSGQLTNDQLTGDLAEWLITEMSKDDYDLVYLQHWMLYATRGTYTYRDGTPQSTDNIGGSQVLKNLVTSRKNKASGSVTDKDGVSHSYDFTGCKHDLLCALHGHQHEEIYAILDNLLCYVADWYGNDSSCVFGIIDRFNSKLWIYKFDATNTYAELSLSI